MPEPRPRDAARWRPLLQRARSLPPLHILFTLSAVFLTALVVTIPVDLGLRAVGLRLDEPLVMLGRVALLIVAAHSSYRFVVRRTEGREAREVSLRGAPAELAAGVLTGAAIMGGALAALWGLGCYEATGRSAWAVVVPYLIQSAQTGYMEELLIRGLVYRVLEEWQGTWIALAVSALLFGMLHLGRPDATLYSTFAIALEAGVLLGAAYVLTGRVWLAVGTHFAWNFTQGGIFGVAVSGGAPRASLLHGRMTGPELLTGGAFGAEGSILTVALGVAVAAGLLRLAHARGRIVPRPRPAPPAERGMEAQPG